MEQVFHQMNVEKLKLRNRMSVELANAILIIRNGLKRDNILKHVMIMTEIPEAVTMGSFIGTSLVCNESNTAESCISVNNRDWFCRMRFKFAYFHNYVLFFCVCLFLLQFGLFWPFFQAHLVYFMETKVATLTSSHSSRRFAACDQGSHWGFFPPISIILVDLCVFV